MRSLCARVCERACACLRVSESACACLGECVRGHAPRAGATDAGFPALCSFALSVSARVSGLGGREQEPPPAVAVD